jgi:hypothetical protein
LPGVNAVATLMYSKIFSDYILGVFFLGIDLETQVLILNIILGL